MTVTGDSPELTQAGLTAIGALNACDEEPISHSGAVQPHGFLLGVDPVTSEVSVASDNVALFTEVAAATILGSTLAAIIGGAAAAQVMTLAGMRQFAEINPLTVVLPGPTSRPGIATFELVVHRSSGLLVLEFTPGGSAAHDLAVVQAGMLRSLRRDQDSAGVEQLCDDAVQELRELTGYDRVMAYRFAADAHGEIIAEARRPNHQPFLGLHYPASDIPRQARLLYFKNRLRLIADVDYTPVPLRVLASAPGAAELDLGQCLLRSVSPVHLEYLRNMGVAATMTISIIVDGRLWGMLACHHDSPRQLSYYVKLASELIGSQLAVRVRDLELRLEHQRRDALRSHCHQVITAMAASEHLARGAAGVDADLLAMADADGAVLQLGGVRIVAGRVPPSVVVDRILAALSQRAQSSSLVTDALPALLREVAAPEGGADDVAVVDPGPDGAGAIYQSLDHRSDDCILWLRGDQATTVRWAGAPASGEDPRVDHLTPRASFAEWLQSARGTSRSWQRAEVTVAAEFAAAMPELVLRRAQNRLVQLALHDPLTGLANRTLLLERLNELAGRDRGDAGPHVGLLYLDLDGFKSVNDTLGHAAGDMLLIDAGRRLKAAVRPGDTVARLGGDEFVVLLDSLTHPDEAAIVAQRIIRSHRIAFPFSPGVGSRVTASIGVAHARAPFDAETLLDQADQALYIAKHAGRDRVAEFNQTATELAARGTRTSRGLRVALGANQLVVHYQPILPAAAVWNPPPGPDQWVGIEALVRWQHPDRGLLEPESFLPVAQESGAIVEVGRYVLTETLGQLATWRRSLPNLSASVNVSAVELADPGYTAAVRRALAEVGLPSNALRLEVTEIQLTEPSARVTATLGALADAGIQVAVDDFGTAYSSSSYVRGTPLSELKIDRSFVAGLPDSARDLALVSSALALARELDLTTTAEGIETPDQLACVQALGVTLVQGFLLSRPMSAQQVDAAISALDPAAPRVSRGI